MNYPLDVGGIGDYPVKVGSMLLTLVEPNPGFERAYNRWYERDHYYAGCLVGPWLFAGSRWVAPRTLKDRRWPADSIIADRSMPAATWPSTGWSRATTTTTSSRGPSLRSGTSTPTDGGSRAHPRPHRALQPVGHGVPRRGPGPGGAGPRPPLRRAGHPVVGRPLGYRRGPLHRQLAADHLGRRSSTGSDIEIASAWVPRCPTKAPATYPWTWGRRRAARTGWCSCSSSGETPGPPPTGSATYTEGVEAAGLADLLLAAPFFRTVIGTDTYVDEL